MDAAIGFCTERLGFEVEMHPAPSFAALRRGDSRLYLNTTGGPGGGALPQRDSHRNRRQPDLLEDPSGNPIELFQPPARG